MGRFGRRMALLLGLLLVILLFVIFFVLPRYYNICLLDSLTSKPKPTAQASLPHPSIEAPRLVSRSESQPYVSVSEPAPSLPIDKGIPSNWPRVLADDARRDLSKPYTVRGIPIINRRHTVNWDYKPVIAGGPNGLQAEAWAAFQGMRKAALAEGHKIYFRSGYRSFGQQVTIYNGYLRTDPGGKKAVDQYSAPPGASEHQSGLAVDIDEGAGLSYQFDQTPAGRWVHVHAQDYGFILRFPQGREAMTGYHYEPWHFRYVGVDLAKKIWAKPLWTLEEELGTGPAPIGSYRTAS